MKKIWGIFWFIAAALGGYALWDTWQLPSESRNAVWMGMSRNKLIMCGVMALLVLFCFAAALTALIKKDKNIFASGGAAGTAAFLIIYLLILGKVFLTPPVGQTAFTRSLTERLMPLAYWGFAFSVLAFIILFIRKIRRIWTYQTVSKAALFWGIFIFIAMEAALYYAVSSGTGTDPVSGTFYRQGVSLLEGQLLLPLLFLYPLFPLFTLLAPKVSKNHREKLFCALGGILIWAAAVFFWQTTPFEGHSYFAPALRLPNNNFYPASDAENYDLLAQSIMLGNGFRNGMTVVRPLYAAFLALLHWIFGNNYMALTNGQILVLALIPVLVYLTGRQLRHTAAGILAAVWVIWREVYSIRMTSLVQVSNSRLLMSDLPTLLLFLAVVLSALKWYRTDSKAVQALLCGGLAGMAMLLRTQCFVLIPAMLLLFICSGKKAADVLRAILLSVIGLVLVFGPWTAWMHFHPNTTADENRSEGQYLVNLYRKAAGETDPDAGLIDIIKNHPAEVFSAVGSHFLNNELSSLLVLPVREELPEESDRLFYEDDLFWYRENARETLKNNQILITVGLVLIAFGIISAYRLAGFAGLGPLIFHLAYNLGNAFALTSGFRFILPSDWVLVFYFGLGCAALLRFLEHILLFRPELPKDEPSGYDEEPVFGKVLTFASAAILLILVGLILPYCDSMIPKRFTEKTPGRIAAEWKATSENAAAILSQVSEDEMVFLEGRAFYPRYYNAGEGDSGGSSSVKRGGDSDRLVWMFHDKTVHVLSCEFDPEQAAELMARPVEDPIDVMIAGLPKEDYVEVLEMRVLTLGTGN
ncbi:MAG: glycosyltransferase family 39 protein [Flexilinea sp.]|nr:glycosyltransferase family 39 protein [Flexilinea sp.]